MYGRFLVGALCAQTLLGLSVGTAWAAPCVNPPVSAETIAQFKQNSRAFVAPSSDARTIEAFVRDLVGTDPSLAADFVKVAEGTTRRFHPAIAAGLAQAAIACSTVDQQGALLIQQAVAGFSDGEFQSAFAAVAGDLSTAATEAAQASAAASVGSVIVVNPNTGGKATTNPGGGGGTLTPITLTAAAVAVTANNNNTVANTAATPVSPTK